MPRRSRMEGKVGLFLNGIMGMYFYGKKQKNFVSLKKGCIFAADLNAR
jgi:hypothetical protein